MILVTGATGTVGSDVVKRLYAQGVDVRAVTRDPRQAETHPLPHVRFVQGDFDSSASMRRACADVDRAFLLTNSTKRARQQQLDFVRMAETSRVRHIVKLSQLQANANAQERFLRYHGVVEAATQASGLTFTFPRSNLYVQGLLNFRQSIQQKSTFFAAATDARISAVDVRNLADVAVAAVDGSGPHHHVRRRTARCHAGGACRSGFPAWQADGLLEEFAMYRWGEAAGVEPGVREALGQAPSSFEEFARDYATQFV